ncbi:cyclic diguanylate phosphodiesterase [Aeromonas allosaccharophila]|uniref:cyclic diguanylate phosphodiesterase n=1 Tax=Aeromonas allosaccharophila TaxID=656 RepID=UPI002AE0910B|nr:cyclic diguanylate phosphodiesterase [Aeromonas allosaccharophila]
MSLPLTPPRHSRWHWLLTLLGCLLPLLFGTALLYLAGLHQQKQHALTTARQLLLRIEQMLTEAERVNSKAADMVGQPCLAALPALRREATKAALVRTINLADHEGAVYCSSLLGRVQQHAPKEAFFVGKIRLLPGSSWWPDHPVLSLRTPVPKGAVIINIDSTHLAKVLAETPDETLHAWLRVGPQWLDAQGHRYHRQPDAALVATRSRMSLRYPFSITVGYPLATQTWSYWIPAHWSALLLLLVGSLGCGAMTRWWLTRPNTPTQALRRGLQANEFVPYVQPVVDARTRQLCGVEVLMRWQHPQAGLLEPACFISQAETSGLIVPMTSQMMAQLIPTLLTQLPQLPAPFHLAVNVSAAHFDTPTLLDNCAQFLSHFLPGKVILTLELTERELLRNDSSTLRMLHQLNAMGVQIALDDFGTGHASLAYLKQFPVDIIKLDRTFVRKIGVETLPQHLADHVIELGRKLGLIVIAEGVETAYQADYLTNKGVDQLQGYLFGHPQPIATWAQSLTTTAVSGTVAVAPAGN